MPNLDPHGHRKRVTWAAVFALATIGLVVLAAYEPRLGLWCAGGVVLAIAVYVVVVNRLER